MRFELLQPGNFSEALEMKQAYGERARILAGGTDLLVLLKDRKLKAEAVMSLRRIRELNFIRVEDGKGVRLGALVTHGDAAASPVIQERFPALGAGAAPTQDFFLGPRQTVLRADEILKEIFIPEVPGRRGATYLKLGRRQAMEIAIVGVGVAIRLNGSDQQIADCRIAMGSVAPIPLRARRGEQVLTSQTTKDELIEEAAEVAAEEASPISDVRASRSYRLDMIRVLC